MRGHTSVVRQRLVTQMLHSVFGDLFLQLNCSFVNKGLPAYMFSIAINLIAVSPVAFITPMFLKIVTFLYIRDYCVDITLSY